MLKDYMGILNLSENDNNIINLTKNRPLASIPIGSRYRIIDFVLSNMVNSGMRNIGLFTQSKSRSLVDHLSSGKPWDLNRRLNGLFVFNFGISNCALNDVEMLRNNMEYLYRSKENHVILSPSYMVCNMDYTSAVKYHEQSGADITIIYKNINDGTKNFLDCDVLNINDTDNVISVGKNIGVEDNLNISMEMFIMSKHTLIALINKCIQTGFAHSLKEAIYNSIVNLNVNCFQFKGHLECVNSVTSYYRANMNMLNLRITKELFFKHGLIYTKVKDEAPTKYLDTCKVSNSLIADACIIEGKVENSIISIGVKIHKGTQIKNCIILQNCEIKENSVLSNVIIDKNVIVEKNKMLKGDTDFPLVIEKRSLF